MSAVFITLCESRHVSFNRPRFGLKRKWPVNAIAKNILPQPLAQGGSLIFRDPTKINAGRSLAFGEWLPITVEGVEAAGEHDTVHFDICEAGRGP